ncbi:hypothetical protein A2U01_0040542 [Trifolium medium]|uniref:Uncharacterized protein n=1 Tax=Trifolium medium TaxID=97028 RepID=A0A392Q761_9FABA|nr:hypothetical protein [Trifolium medium]
MADGVTDQGGTDRTIIHDRFQHLDIKASSISNVSLFMARGIATCQGDTRRNTSGTYVVLRDLELVTTGEMLQKLATDRDRFLLEDGGCLTVVLSITDIGNVCLRCQVSNAIRLALALHNDAGGRIIMVIDS